MPPNGARAIEGIVRDNYHQHTGIIEKIVLDLPDEPSVEVGLDNEEGWLITRYSDLEVVYRLRVEGSGAARKLVAYFHDSAFPASVRDQLRREGRI